MPAYWKPRQALTFLDCIPKCLPSSLDRSKISWGYGFMQNVPYPGASVASLCPADSCFDSGVVEIPNLSMTPNKIPGLSISLKLRVKYSGSRDPASLKIT